MTATPGGPGFGYRAGNRAGWAVGARRRGPPRPGVGFTPCPIRSRDQTPQKTPLGGHGDPPLQFCREKYRLAAPVILYPAREALQRRFSNPASQVTPYQLDENPISQHQSAKENLCSPVARGW